MKLNNLIASLAAVTVLATPVIVQAGTTAAATTGKISSLSGYGGRKSVRVKPRQNLFAGVAVPVLLFGGVGVAVGTYLAVDAIADNKSNGS